MDIFARQARCASDFDLPDRHLHPAAADSGRLLPAALQQVHGAQQCGHRDAGDLPQVRLEAGIEGRAGLHWQMSSFKMLYTSRSCLGFACCLQQRHSEHPPVLKQPDLTVILLIETIAFCAQVEVCGEGVSGAGARAGHAGVCVRVHHAAHALRPGRGPRDAAPHHAARAPRPQGALRLSEELLTLKLPWALLCECSCGGLQYRDCTAGHTCLMRQLLQTLETGHAIVRRLS